jgi:hypothetical protein
VKEHGEMDEVLNRSNVRDGSGNRRDTVRKEGILFSSLRDGDISVNRIFIVDDAQIFHCDRMETRWIAFEF